MSDSKPLTPDKAKAKKLWIAASIMLVAALMDMLDGTVVNIALPTIETQLHASPTALTWIVSGYMLTFAAILIIAGRLGDRFGRRKLFLFGVVTFGLASLLSGLSQTADQLVIFRLLQGASAAILIPQVLATYRTVFSGKDRAAAFGMYGAVSGFAVIVGVILGGVLTQANVFGLGWRAIFLINVPVALFITVATLFAVPETKHKSTGRIDILGAIVLALGIGAIVYPLLEGQQYNWPTWCFLLMAAGIIAIASLGLLERRREKSGVLPLLQVKQFKVPAFSAGALIQFLFTFGLQGFSIVFIIWLQAGHHFTPIQASLALLAFSVGTMISAPNAGKQALKYGRKVLMLGAVLLAIGTAATAAPAWLVNGDVNAWMFVPGFILSGIGLGLLVVPLINVVLAAVPAEASGGASGVFSTAQQLGGAVGVAIIGSVFFARIGNGDFTTAFRVAVPLVVVSYLACGVLCWFLPKEAVSDEKVMDVA